MWKLVLCSLLLAGMNIVVGLILFWRTHERLTRFEKICIRFYGFLMFAWGLIVPVALTRGGYSFVQNCVMFGVWITGVILHMIAKGQPDSR